MTGDMLANLMGRAVRRPMLVAAHPDDEIIGAGAHMGEWPGLTVVHATNGAPRDPRYAVWAGFADPPAYARGRRAEALAALALAGIGDERLVSLNCDDQQASRQLVELSQSLHNLFLSARPDVVVTHPYEGGHPDHDAVCFAVHHACRQLRRDGVAAPAIVEMTSYFGRDGQRVVSEFMQGDTGAEVLPLSLAQQDLKRRMYRSFASQYSLLAQFPVARECFRRAPDYDFTRKPAETVFYDGFDLGTASDEWLALAGVAERRLPSGSLAEATVVPAEPDSLWRSGRAAVGQVDFGDFARETPIGTMFGYDRGTPIDRPYIEDFLDRHRADIRGRVLEVGDNAYTLRFGGGRVTRSDVLHVHGNAPGATIVGDLADAPHIADGTFDCLLLTQVLEMIFDLRAAVATMHRILKPGGVALVTVPGITNLDHGEWNAGWMWSFTTNSLARLLGEKFAKDDVSVASCGNVFTAVSFLQGLALEDIAGFDHRRRDPHYQVTVIGRARKAMA